MAKKVKAEVKIQLPAGKATSGPKTGSSLGPHGINISAFIKEFNEKTAKQEAQCPKTRPEPTQPSNNFFYQNTHRFRHTHKVLYIRI